MIFVTVRQDVEESDAVLQVLEDALLLSVEVVKRNLSPGQLESLLEFLLQFLLICAIARLVILLED